MINSSSSQTLAQPLHPLDDHHHSSPAHSRGYVSLHHPQQQNLLNNMLVSEAAQGSSYNPTDCLEMSDVIAGDAGVGGGAAQSSEHYIYVTYPPELKRRLLERY